MLEAILTPPVEIARAFADDIGMVLANISQLRPVRALYKLLEIISGMAIKPRKCVIVPLA